MRHSFGNDHVTYAAHMIYFIRASIYILGKRDRILISKIFDQLILTVFLHKFEAVFGFDILKRVRIIPISFVAVFIHDHFGIIGNTSMILRAKVKVKITIVINNGDRTSIKSSISNRHHTLWYCNTHKRAGIKKCLLSYLGNAIRYSYIRQSRTTTECTMVNPRHAIRDINISQALTPGKNPTRYICHSFRNSNIHQTRT